MTTPAHPSYSLEQADDDVADLRGQVAIMGEYLPVSWMLEFTAGSKAIFLSPSGDTTGVADADLIQNAVTNHSHVILIPGTWYLTCGSVAITDPGRYIYARGCVINAVGTGDVFSWSFSGTYSGLTTVNGGLLGRPVIDGTSAGAGSAGIHAGDIESLEFDVCVKNFSGAGSVGVHFDNRNYWTERLNARIWANNCATGVLFDVSGATTSTNSYARGQVMCYITQANATFDGVVFNNGAVLYDGTLGIFGNFQSSGSALTSAMLRVTGTVPAGHPGAGNGSAVRNGALWIGAECASGANTPTTIILGGGSNGIGPVIGAVDTGANFTQANLTFGWIFQGPVSGDTSLMIRPWYGNRAQTVTANGQTLSVLNGVLVANPGASNFTGMILATPPQPGMVVWVVNRGTGSLTFAAAGTSNVADGVADVINGGTARGFVWDSASALWYKMA